MADRLRQNPDDITIEDEDTDDLPGALLGSIPVAIVYSFFVEHYVSGLTGSVKG